jgi:predicted ATP-dependent endonuclease of OLD family
MKLIDIHIQNYRGLKDAQIPLSEFVCLIGRNNSGKSSFLQCLSLVGSGTKLKESDYYDSSAPIRIELGLGDIGQADLARVEVEQHRDRFTDLIQDGQLRLVRTYEPLAGKSTLRVVKKIPSDPRLNPADLQEVMKGKTGAELRSAAIAKLPELDAKLDPKPTQKAILAELDLIIAGLDDSQLVPSDELLPTGLDKSIVPLLPEVVYIPAVKDVTDEIKTTESATFGKLLRILFDQIEDQFEDLEAQFADLQTKLSRVVIGDVVTDNRLSQVRLIEDTIQKFVQHNFPDVKLTLEVPAPKLGTILNSAELHVDDGFEGPISSKGDGLKRAVAFAVLQAYAELKAKPTAGSGEEGTRRHPYVLLFEEPELYLHPAAQAQLFSALEAFAQDQTVIVTTHNPSFFSASSTKTFVKLSKRPAVGETAPFSETFPIDLDDMTSRDQLQLIGYENNNAALFSDRVVLVEGDSDFIIFPHLMKLLISPQELTAVGLSFVRISGKGSARRYRNFFKKFLVPVFSITDLDILTNQFDKLEPSTKASQLRSELIAELDAMEDNGEEASSSSLKDIRKSGETQGLWQAARTARAAWLADQTDENWLALEHTVGGLLDRIESPVRYSRLKGATAPTIVKLKLDLLDELRSQGAHVLSQGCLEDYFPEHLNSGSKVEDALRFCSTCATADDLATAISFKHELEQMFATFVENPETSNL